MQEILFRGKSETDGRWVEGFYTKSPSGNTYIMETVCGAASPKVVDPETVCQYTGQIDKNGNRIFEGDIVLVNTSGIDEEDGTGVISWDNEEAMYVIKINTFEISFQSIYGHECEVIGNRWDNPELLEV